jgi:hypothetical protein
MLFTYKDKGPATVFAYPSNQRPMTKYNSIPNIPGKPNPIKQWRKQIAPSVSEDVIQSHPTMQSLENGVKTDMDLCKSYTDVLYVDTCNGVSGSNPCVTGSFQITRSASTIIDKKFCWNSKQYLQSRCKTYDQNQTIGPHVEGTQYYSGSCIRTSSGTVCKPIIHKPNNKSFQQQGSVSSSARIAKLKYDTIVKSSTTNKYDSLLANLDSSSHILNRKPVPCRGWRPKGKRPYSATASCNQTSKFEDL